MPEGILNNFSTTIAGSSTSTTTGSKQVASTTGMLAGVVYRFLCESEIIVGMLVDGTHINFLERGAEGSTAAGHATSTVITQIITALGARATVLDSIPDYAIVGEDDFCQHQSNNNYIFGNYVQYATSGGSSDGYVMQIPSVANHPGLIGIHTGATANEVIALSCHTGANSLLSSDKFDFRSIFALTQTGAGTEVRIGLSDGYANDEIDGFFIEKLTGDNNWFYNRMSASSSTRTDSGIACDTSYHRFRVRRIDSSTIGFSIDGVEIATTTGAPSATNITPYWKIKNPSTAADKIMTLDWWKSTVNGLSR